MKKIKYVIVLLLSVIIISCSHDFWFDEIGNKNNISTKPNYSNIQLRPLDSLFIKGFTMELEEVYITEVNGLNVRLKDSCFATKPNNVVTLPSYQRTSYDSELILNGLTKNMKWVISEMELKPNTKIIEHGYGTTYSIATISTPIPTNYIDLGYKDSKFVIHYQIESKYKYRHKDNHILDVYVMDKNQNQYSNLKLEIFQEYNSNSKYFYLLTNSHYTLAYSYTPPLTADEVRIKVEKGEYEIYLWRGLNTIKIGNNLYIPRFNSYVYVGTSNDNGMITQYENFAYLFKFRIIK